jgi:hypothetical protein
MIGRGAIPMKEKEINRSLSVSYHVRASTLLTWSILNMVN